MTITCPVCSADAMPVAEYRHAHRVFARLQRVMCKGCGMTFATPMPDETALAEYNARYFLSAHGGIPTEPVTVAFHSGINKLRTSHVERFLRDRDIRVSSVLEVGPGGGYFARHWLRGYPGSTYHAIESDVACHATLREMGVRLHPAADAVPSVDLLVMSHVLEHVADPIGFLDSMSRPLRRGGVLFIEVPCRDWEHKDLDEPHLLFFDKQPMARLLERLRFSHMLLTYHGREITDLRRNGTARRVIESIRMRFLRYGVIGPFGRLAPGLEVVDNPLDRAAVRPVNAHREQQRPAWWLRALAVKT